MKKKILISSVILVIILVAGMGFWKWKGVKNAEVLKNEQVQQQVQGEQQNQDDLVWYEIPELGIKFKVTPNTKEDLGYKFKEYGSGIKIKDGMLYSKSQTDENLAGCALSENSGLNCGFFQIDTIDKNDAEKYLEESGKYWCVGTGGVIIFDGNRKICGYKIIDNVITDKEYKDFFDISNNLQNNKYGIYLDTIEQIK